MLTLWEEEKLSRSEVLSVFYKRRKGRVERKEGE